MIFCIASVGAFHCQALAHEALVYIQIGKMVNDINYHSFSPGIHIPQYE